MIPSLFGVPLFLPPGDVSSASSSAKLLSTNLMKVRTFTFLDSFLRRQGWQLQLVARADMRLGKVLRGFVFRGQMRGDLELKV